MTLYGTNTMTIRGPAATIEMLVETGVVLDTSNNVLMGIANQFFGPQQITILNHEATMIQFTYDLRNAPITNYLQAILETYPDCWIKNTFTSESGHCGLWIGRMQNGSTNIQELEWTELSAEELASEF